MEECLGGEFFDRLAVRAKQLNMYTERDAAKIFKQILEAVNYLHAHGVCHRDLKPENILFSTIEEDSPLKLIDFGLSKVFNGDDNTMKGAVGTTFYMAPEVILRKNYSFAVDFWSIGVILFEVFYGKLPFGCEAKDPQMIYHAIQEDQLVLASDIKYEGVNGLIRGLLNKNPMKRLK